jgi:hypothetical protein
MVIVLLFCEYGFAQSTHVPAALNSQVEKIRIWTADPIVIRAIEAQNKEGNSLEKIKEMDRAWTAAAELTPEMKDMISNECSTKLKKLSSELPAVIETFVMDAQGANVCMTNRTSDYWQGDEAKWKDAFNNGKGAEIVSQRQYDESSKATLVHVSLPVMSGGKAIGVVTCGINLGKLAETTARQ